MYFLFLFQYINFLEILIFALELLTQFNDCKDIQENNHFSKKRLIDEKILLSYKLKQDKIKNILSPTFILDRAKNTNFVAINQVGYVSYLSSPIKKDKFNQEYQKPIKQLCYGNKGLEILKEKTSKKEDIKHIIITESICDSLSLLELKAYNPKHTLLCSTNGAISQNQKELLEYFSQNFTHSQIILGFDNDDKGQDFTQTCLELFKVKLSKAEFSNIELSKTKPFNEETQTKSQIKPFHTSLNKDNTSLNKDNKNNKDNKDNQIQKLIIEKPILKDFNDDLNAYKLLNLGQNFTLKELENKISKLHLNGIDDFLKKEKLLNGDSYKKRAQDALMLSKILAFLKPKLENYINYEKIDKSLEKINHYFQKNILQKKHKNHTSNKEY